MKRIRLALAVVAFTCGACTAGPSISSAPPESPASPTTDPSPSAAPLSALDGCPNISPDGLDGIVARAVDGLDDTAADDGWSRACGWLTAVGGSGEPRLLTIDMAWWGSLHEYSSAPGAKPIDGLADEAYALDLGDRIALRSGELVVIVSYSGATAFASETLARLVAARLPE